MVKHQPIPSPNTPVTRKPCEDCDGKGSWLTTVTVSGEAMDADQRSVDCASCEGLGYVETDPECPCCEAVLVNGWCASCEEYALTEIEHIAPGRIAA